MQLYLAVTPGKFRTVRAKNFRPVHMAYRIDGAGRLVRREQMPHQGGLMGLADGGSGPIRDAEALCRQVRQECAARNFSGVLADFEEPMRGDRAAFLARLAAAMKGSGQPLYLPEEYAPHVPGSRVLICTALSGGSLRRRLGEAVEIWGRERVALDLQRLRMVFPLPCPSGQGRPIDGAELKKLLEEKSPSVFYSADLAAKYFTYTTAEGSFFCLFDTADTLSRKLQLGQELGIGEGFLMYPETADLLERLGGGGRK